MASIRHRGDKWQVQIRRTGHTPISKSFLTKRDALAWARHMEVHADNGELPNHRHDRKVLQGITLGELVVRYRDTVTPKKRGKDVETIVLNAFLRHPLGQKRVSELDARDFAAYRDERLKTVKPSTLRRQFAPLHNLFEVAKHEWGIPVKDNPLAKVDLVSTCRHRERRLKAGEWERLVTAAKSRKNPFVFPIMHFAVETGMRRGEILGVELEHRDRNNQTLYIPHTKNGHSRTIPLSGTASSILDSLSDPSSASQKVFNLTANAFRLAWERTRSSAQVVDLHFHDLRHEAISRFFEKGLSVPEVALISGHRDPRMLFRYAHPMTASIHGKLQES